MNCKPAKVTLEIDVKVSFIPNSSNNETPLLSYLSKLEKRLNNINSKKISIQKSHSLDDVIDFGDGSFRISRN